ncbi:hypothetical protein Taro_053724, partial [Colocasia esculenta]|nr:hypothetical protein [Colocasia esculenta]
MVPWWFWWRFSQDLLALLLQFCLLQCSILRSMLFGRWVVHSGEGSSQDRPLSLLAEVLPRSAPCLFRATVVLPLWFEVCRLVGLHSVCLGIFGQGVVPLAMRLAVVLARLPWCSFPSFSIAPVGLCVSPWLGLFVFPVPGVLSQMVVW